MPTSSRGAWRRGRLPIIVGINVVGLRRRGFARAEIHRLRSAYRSCFWAKACFATGWRGSKAAYAGDAADRERRSPLSAPASGRSSTVDRRDRRRRRHRRGPMSIAATDEGPLGVICGGGAVPLGGRAGASSGAAGASCCFRCAARRSRGGRRLSASLDRARPVRAILPPGPRRRLPRHCSRRRHRAAVACARCGSTGQRSSRCRRSSAPSAAATIIS